MKSIVALFEHERDVQRALSALAERGIAPEQIAVVRDGAGAGQGGISAVKLHGRLLDAGIPPRDADSYVMGLLGGRTLIAVRVGDELAEAVRRIVRKAERVYPLAGTGDTTPQMGPSPGGAGYIQPSPPGGLTGHQNADFRDEQSRRPPAFLPARDAGLPGNDDTPPQRAERAADLPGNDDTPPQRAGGG